MFHLTTHSTHFNYGLYGVRDMVKLYGVRHIVKDHSDSEDRKPAAANKANLSD